MRSKSYCAIIRVWKFERNSIYIDMHFISCFYGRYVDDASSLAPSKDEAVSILNKIAERDPSGRLKWEVDFPEEPTDFTPFLDTEIRIGSEGRLESRFYRKPQKKKITLN